MADVLERPRPPQPPPAAEPPPAERLAGTLARAEPPSPPPAKATARYRAYRLRRKNGVRLVRVEVDEHVLDLLTRGGFLAEWDDGNRAAIEAALAIALRVWSTYGPP